jgi:hypothetical protein
MPPPGHPKALDAEKQKTVCSLVEAGVSLRQAAHFVDCDPKTIRREAQRNDDFRQQLARAKSEASIHPLQTLRQAAKTNWRAALCWMERLDPQRFARHNPKTITQREASQFAVDLAESIERAVSEPSERQDLFELLSAAMPAAMRRRWDGKGRRRTLAEAIDSVDAKKMDALEQRCKRRRDLMAQIGSYLPWNLVRILGQYGDLFDLPDQPDAPDEPPTPSSNSPAPSLQPPTTNTVPPPRPYSNHSAAQPSPNHVSPNDLAPGPEANPPE